MYVLAISGASRFLTGIQILESGPKFIFYHAQGWVEHFKLIFLFKYSNTNITFFKTTEAARE